MSYLQENPHLEAQNCRKELANIAVAKSGKLLGIHMHGCRKGFRSGGAIARSRGLEAVVHT